SQGRTSPRSSLRTPRLSTPSSKAPTAQPRLKSGWLRPSGRSPKAACSSRARRKRTKAPSPNSSNYPSFRAAFTKRAKPKRALQGEQQRNDHQADDPHEQLQGQPDSREVHEAVLAGADHQGVDWRRHGRAE